MRAVVSRVSEASVTVDDTVVASIEEPGLLVLLGVHQADPETAAARMARKLHELRILRDEESCASSGAPLLLVSQFTLYGDTRKGRRPSWTAAAPPDTAAREFTRVISELTNRGARVANGRFGAAMAVHSVNDGPFTVLVDV